MKTLKQNLIQTFKVIILASILSLGLGLVQAWVGPTQAPTGGNTETPINVGSATQIKTGALWAEGLLSSAGGYFAGNVGIGVSNPTEKLDIDGGIKATGDITTGGNITAGGDITTGGNITTGDVYITAVGKWTSELFPTYLVYNRHTVTQCSTIGVVHNSGGVKFCKIAGASCPGGWIQYGSWNTTPPRTCSVVAGGCNGPCTTGSHSFSNNATVYYCSYNWGYMYYDYYGSNGRCIPQAYYTCSSTRSVSGCY